MTQTLTFNVHIQFRPIQKKKGKKIIQNKRENTLHLFLKYKTKTARTTHIQKNKKNKPNYDTYSYCRCFDCEFIHASFSYLSTTMLPLNGYAPCSHNTSLRLS